MILHELTVGQTVVLRQADPAESENPVPPDVMPLGRVMLGEFRRDYDEAATLEFVLYKPWNETAFQADQLVTLKLTDTDTGQSRIVFTGLLDPVRPIASVHQGPAQQYTARDHSHALHQAQALHSNGRPGIRLPGSTLGAMVTEYLTHVTGELTRVGVATDALYTGGADAVEAWPVSLDTESIDEGFRMIAAAAPGVAVFLDPIQGTPTYRFVRLFNAPRRTITLDETRVEEASIAQSVAGCCGAVETAPTFEIGEYTDYKVVPLAPAWEPGLEEHWVPSDAWVTEDLETGEPATISEVHRKFSFSPSEAPDLQPGAKMVALVKEPVYPQQYTHAEIASIDFEASTVMLKWPAIEGAIRHGTTRKQMQIKGEAETATVKLRYVVEGGAPLTTDAVRVPELGFAGRAVAISPITCGYCKLIEVPSGVEVEAYAQAAFESLSEPRASGSVPIVGRLDLDLFFLRYRIAFDTASNGPTNAEDLDAPMTGVTVGFASGGEASISFNRDRAILLSQGGA